MLLLGAPPQSVAASQVRGLRMEVSKSALSLRDRYALSSSMFVWLAVRKIRLSAICCVRIGE